MSEIANARIKAFGKSPKADFVSPSDQLITLTIGQLQDLITQAVEKAIQPLQDEAETLRATILVWIAKSQPWSPHKSMMSIGSVLIYAKIGKGSRGWRVDLPQHQHQRHRQKARRPLPGSRK